MKVQYVGYHKLEDSYRIFLLKQATDENSKGMKPVLKYAKGIGLYYPKVKELPKASLGEVIEIVYDEKYNIVFV